MKDEQLSEKIRRFCAWRERCTQEVTGKLLSLGTDKRLAARLVAQLQEEGFLNDRRFAKMFARGKFENNRWGRIKIRTVLLQKDISPSTVSEALTAIDDDRYRQTLQQLIKKKIKELSEKNKEHIKQKTAVHCIQKGYEPDLVREYLGF